MGKTQRKTDTNKQHQDITNDKFISSLSQKPIGGRSLITPPIYKIVGHARVSKSSKALSLKIDEGLIPRYFVISKRNLTDLFVGKESVIQIREYDGINKETDTNGSEKT